MSEEVRGERAAYTRLFLMAQVPFRSIARLRRQCEPHTESTPSGGAYGEGLGRGYRRALAEIDRTLEERPSRPESPSAEDPGGAA